MRTRIARRRFRCTAVPLLSFALLAPLAVAGDAVSGTPVAIPGGQGGIGFDDMRFAPVLGRVLVPAGRTGALALVDPAGGAVRTIAGFSRRSEKYSGGHDDGPTSADEGAGFLFVSDRTAKRLFVVDPGGKIVGGAPFSAGPDYVRFVSSTREVWATEPDAERIEVFRIGPRGEAESVAKIPVPGGPESLVVDPRGARAYTHLWKGGTVTVDVASRKVGAVWKNGCAGSRGIALDAAKGFLFVACAEGRAATLDTATGRLLGEVRTGEGVDIVDYDPSGGRLYVPAGRSGTLSVIQVAASGSLTVLGTVPAPRGAHCVAAAGAGRVFVCDPGGGRVIEIRDPFPRTPAPTR